MGGLADHVNSQAYATSVGLVMYAHRNGQLEPVRVGAGAAAARSLPGRRRRSPGADLLPVAVATEVRSARHTVSYPGTVPAGARHGVSQWCRWVTLRKAPCTAPEPAQSSGHAAR